MVALCINEVFVRHQQWLIRFYADINGSKCEWHRLMSSLDLTLLEFVTKDERWRHHSAEELPSPSPPPPPLPPPPPSKESTSIYYYTRGDFCIDRLLSVAAQISLNKTNFHLCPYLWLKTISHVRLHTRASALENTCIYILNSMHRVQDTGYR